MRTSDPDLRRAVCVTIILLLLLAAGQRAARASDLAGLCESLPPLYCGRTAAELSPWNACQGTEPVGGQPVLFVHGHDFFEIGEELSFRKSWLERRSSGIFELPSFGDALGDPRNAEIGLEPYYVELEDKNRAVEIDGCFLRRAVDAILERHGDPAAEAVKVVLVGHSKGTISSRLYLADLDAAGDPRKPVSELVALSPANHGVVTQMRWWLENSKALRQLNNGLDRHCRHACAQAAGCSWPDGGDCSPPSCREPQFISDLNGPDGLHEAPDSRAPADDRGRGTLYLALYDEADISGGSGAHSDDPCARRVGQNHGPNAVNQPVQVGGLMASVKHANTPHTPEVICRTLYTASHRHLAPANLECPLQPASPAREGVPGIPRGHRGLALVLDVSGSMSLTPEGQEPGQGERTRLDLVKESAELFVTRLRALRPDDAHLTLVTFPRRSFDPAACDGQVRMPMSLTSQAVTDAARQAIGGLGAAGRTPLLAGLERALDGFAGEEGKAIVLLTDGYPNCPPGASPDELITDLQSRGVRVFPIAFGQPGDADPSFLAALASEPGDFIDVTENLSPAEIAAWQAVSLNQAFSDILTAALDAEAGLDPVGSIDAGDTVEDRLLLGPHDRRVSFALSWARPAAAAPGLELRVFDSRPEEVREGEPGVSVVRRPTYTLLTVDERYLELPDRVGESPWRIVIDAGGLPAGSSESYHYDAILDSDLRMDVRFDRPRYAAGDTITLGARLTLRGEPLTGALVTAEVGRPEDGRGNWLAANAVAPAELAKVPLERAGEPLSAVVRKSLYLTDVRGVAFPGRLAPQTLLLNDEGVRGDAVAGDGIYSTEYSDTPREGTYVFRVRAVPGEGAAGARFRRERVAHQVLGVRPDAERTEVTVDELRRVESLRRFRIVVAPRDRLGNYLGPVHAGSIGMELSAGRFLDDGAVDFLDGSYGREIELPAGVGPGKVEVGLDVLGASQSWVLAEKLPAVWRIGWRFGRGFLQGALGRDFDPGPALGLDVERRLDEQLAVLGRLDHFRFPARTPGSQDGRLWGLSVSVRRDRAVRAGLLYGALGAGAYRPRGGSTEPGARVEVGFERPLRGAWSVGFSAAWHRVLGGGDEELLDVGFRLALRL